MELKSQLDRAGTSDLIKRIEAAVRATGAEAARQRLRRVTEERVGQVVVGRPEVGVIKNVEELRAETEVQFSREVKLALDGKIDLCCAEAAQDVSAEIALRTGGGI